MKSMIVNYLVKIFLPDKVCGDNKDLSLNLISRCIGRLVFVSLYLFSKCLSLLQLSPFRLRLSLPTRIAECCRDVTPAQ